MEVSVLLLTYNEERNLPRCLESLSWCDDIIIVDSFSTDNTVLIAASGRARVLTRPFDNFANQRNFGLSEGKPRHKWVLHLDADEVVTQEFRCKLLSLDPPEEIDAYRVPSKTILHEKWLRYSGMYPTYQVRLGRREELRFKQVGHGQREDLAPERVGTFSEPYLHYNFSQGINTWLKKHVKYAEDEAATIFYSDMENKDTVLSIFQTDSMGRRRALKSLINRMPNVFRPFLRFFYIMIVCRGFLDGRHGLLYAIMLSVYEGMIGVFVMSDRLSGRIDSGMPQKKNQVNAGISEK